MLAVPLLASALFLGACTDDENNGNEGNPPTPPVTDAGQLVTSIANDDGVAKFNYDKNNVMTSGTDISCGQFTIETNPIVIKANDDGEVLTIDNVQTNGQGYITSADYEYSWYEDNDTPERIPGKMTCEYNSNGNLTEIVMHDIYLSGYEQENTWNYTWEDGNLVSQKQGGRSKQNAESDWDEWYYRTTEYMYDDWATDNAGIYLGYMIEEVYMDFLFYAGYFGKPSRQIPGTVIDNVGDTEEEAFSLAVTTDEKGRITSVMSDDWDLSLSCVYAYDGETAVFPSQAQAAGKARQHTIHKRFRR